MSYDSDTFSGPKTRRSLARLAGVGVAALLLGAACEADAPATLTEAPVAPPDAPQQVEQAPPAAVEVPAPVVPVPGAPATFADLVEQVRPGVVYISTTQLVQVGRRDYWGRQYGVPETRATQSLGSGFIVDPDGHILTNSHVISGAAVVRVTLYDGTEYDAQVIGVDPATDLALIEVEPEQPLTALPLGDSDAMRVGDWTIAVGNPFGLSATVTVGILSATNRRDVPVGGEMRYVDFLQTDASINPGNSGGPLLNMQGEVIGVNTAINPEGQGIGFAIPANMASTVLEQLLEHGAVARSWLGIFIGEVDQDVALLAGMQDVRGALVTRVVPGGPAALAGIRVGDVILAFAGEDITSSDELPWIASTAGVGARVPVHVARGSQRLELAVTMGELPD